jgi:hypothetical protein
MATTERPRHLAKPASAAQRAMRGFDYLTLDPSPRLRKLREEQSKRTADPTEVVRQAWLSVGAAIAEAFRVTRETDSSQSR